MQLIQTLYINLFPLYMNLLYTHNGKSNVWLNDLFRSNLRKTCVWHAGRFWTHRLWTMEVFRRGSTPNLVLEACGKSLGGQVFNQPEYGVHYNDSDKYRRLNETGRRQLRHSSDMSVVSHLDQILSQYFLTDRLNGMQLRQKPLENWSSEIKYAYKQDHLRAGFFRCDSFHSRYEYKSKHRTSNQIRRQLPDFFPLIS